MNRIILAIAGLGLGTTASAQMAPMPAPPMFFPQPARYFVEIPARQVDLVMKAGSDRVYFSGNDYGLNAGARATLAAQARWLLGNPDVRALIEGHSDQRDTREHALAIGERRATAVRDYLVSLGVPAARLSVMSWGKERPIQPAPGDFGQDRNPRVVTVIVR